MAKPKKIKDAVRLSVVLSKAQADRLQQRAIQMSMQEGRQITVSEAVRTAIEAVYPLPKQFDLFSN
jgi:hypothetical protein